MTVQLKEVDGVLMLPLSSEAQATLSLTADSSVSVEVDGVQLIVSTDRATRRPLRRYKLSELLADYDRIPRDAEEEYEWLNAPPVGRELI